VVPLETARACAPVAVLAEMAATKGNVNARADAGVAALMAEAGCRGAAFNVKVNVDALEDSGAAHGLTEAAENFVKAASAAAKRTAELVSGA
jgi:formiminotetrahydrofolate cyclodeaminase